MITKDTVKVYAQYNEDIILASILSKTEKGFYVDVGANHESYHSVTKYFYERRWSGINIEPIKRLVAEFNKKRTRDINLCMAVATTQGKLILREYPDQDGLSTLSQKSMQESDKEKLTHRDYEVQTNTLKNIFEQFKVASIDFIKIDVEGYEFEVLTSNDWEKFRPKVICIEANHKTYDWSGFIESKKYKRVIFDGLNEYYLANEHLYLMDHYAERATLLMHNALRDHHWNQWKSDEEDISNLRKFARKQDEQIRNQANAIEVLKQSNSKNIRRPRKTIKK